MSMVQLRQGTHLEHERLERRLDVLKRLRTRIDYRSLLERLYGLYAPLEIQLLQLAQRKPLPLDVESRLKVPLLVRDLAVLGLDSRARNALPHCAVLLELEDAATALGCLYVLEGSTLGGQIIARHLQHQLAIEADSGSAFFTSYGARVGPMWRTFCAALTDYPSTPIEQVAMVSAARATFELFEQWLLEAGPLWHTPVLKDLEMDP